MYTYHRFWYCLIILGLAHSCAWSVRFINVTQDPVYYAVYYKKSNTQAIRYGAPQEGFYTAQPGQDAFLAGSGYAVLPSSDFTWPDQACESRGLGGECRTHYPRTVFFSFAKQDIIAGQVDISRPQGSLTTYQGKNIGSALYQGWNVEAGKTYLIYYNPFGFDSLYAVQGKKDSDVKAGKLNAAQANTQQADALRRYLSFVQYTFFGK